MKINGFSMLFLFAGIRLFSQTAPIITIEPPEWLLPLREAVYEHILTADEIKPLYAAATTAARSRYSGTALDLALSRAEYFMGRALQDNNQNDAARPHYSEGLRLAERALAASPGSDAWLLRALNLSQLCSINPWHFTLANGLDVERFSRNALNFDSRNAAAQFLIAARWVYAPAPFNNYSRGIQMMKDILENGDFAKDDLFNIYTAISSGYAQQRKFDDSRAWLLKALEIYPENKDAAKVLEQIGRGR